jgi:hypothetical protein
VAVKKPEENTALIAAIEDVIPDRQRGGSRVPPGVRPLAPAPLRGSSATPSAGVTPPQRPRRMPGPLRKTHENKSDNDTGHGVQCGQERYRRGALPDF